MTNCILPSKKDGIEKAVLLYKFQLFYFNVFRFSVSRHYVSARLMGKCVNVIYRLAALASAYNIDNLLFPGVSLGTVVAATT